MLLQGWLKRLKKQIMRLRKQMRKAMRAANWIPAKVKFPVWAMPKIDGVRALNMTGTLTGRSQKKHKNTAVTARFSKVEYIGLDGEMAAERETHPDLCRITSSVMGTIDGSSQVMWHLFDYITSETINLPYRQRYAMLYEQVAYLRARGHTRLKVLPYVVCNTLAELEAVHQNNMEAGYEGTCFYGPDVMHKEGKSSPTHNGVLRIKDFIDGEARVLSIAEGDTNNNEAQTNELGRTFRTSHKDNKTPNGLLGSMECEQLADLFDLHDAKKLLMAKGQIFTCSPGKMTEDQKREFLASPEQIVGKTIKFKFFPKGIKDKPRFPNFDSIRSAEDMGGD
jgi:DNA ligase-1